MQSKATTIEAYLTELPEDRKQAVTKLHQLIVKSLPKGFESVINYGMIGYVVPHSVYPAGYHCNPALPLPFAGLASQKNVISFYHMALYADEQLMNWFVKQYEKVATSKLDMGKSCIRFKKAEHIPFDLIVELIKKISAKEWIRLYEEKLKK